MCREFWEGHPAGKRTREFAEELVRGTVANLESIDEMISSTVANWTMDRLTAVDRAILRFAAYEFMYLPDVPPKVTIDEAIEIAKAYGTVESGRFINGVLDKIREKMEASGSLARSPGTGNRGD